MKKDFVFEIYLHGPFLHFKSIYRIEIILFSHLYKIILFYCLQKWKEFVLKRIDNWPKNKLNNALIRLNLTKIFILMPNDSTVDQSTCIYRTSFLIFIPYWYDDICSCMKESIPLYTYIQVWLDLNIVGTKIKQINKFLFLLGCLVIGGSNTFNKTSDSITWVDLI